MLIKSCLIFLGTIALVSCNSFETKNRIAEPESKSQVLSDSAKSLLINALDSLIILNSSPDDITISAKFINQGKYDNADPYITVKTKNDSVIVLTNPMPLKEVEIAQLKKEGNNVTLTYRQSDKKVKFLAIDFEPER